MCVERGSRPRSCVWREGVGQDHVCGEREEGKIMCVERGRRPRSCVWREGGRE